MDLLSTIMKPIGRGRAPIPRRNMGGLEPKTPMPPRRGGLPRLISDASYKRPVKPISIGGVGVGSIPLAPVTPAPTFAPTTEYYYKNENGETVRVRATDPNEAYAQLPESVKQSGKFGTSPEDLAQKTGLELLPFQTKDEMVSGGLQNILGPNFRPPERVPPRDFGFGPGIMPPTPDTFIDEPATKLPISGPDTPIQPFGSPTISQPAPVTDSVTPTVAPVTASVTDSVTPTVAPVTDLVTTTVDPVTTAPTPSAPISNQGTDPIQSMPVGALDPVLLGQTAQENLTDPLVRALYFGTADQPGFYQQLQQAGANLIGQDVPLQQTAGLTPLELLARQQAVAGLGGFEPFLQQNKALISQAIEQSERAEALQDPYYTQAENIYKDTMGAYDPAMTKQFYNPFEDAVVQQTIEDVMEAGEKRDIASRAREISAGAFGGSRARLGAMERQEALGEGLAQALGRIRQQGFSEAQRTGLSEFARQQAAKRTGAQGLIGIGTGRGSAASSLGQQLAGYGGELSGLGAAQENLRSGQRSELAGFGSTGRGITETGLSRIYQQQLGQQQRPLSVIGQIGSMLPGYQQTSTQIGSQYGLPTDPSAAGLGAAFSAYGALAPRQGQS